MIPLHPHLTVLVGPNGSGKTACFRAARWCALNVPAGTRFLRRGAQAVTAELEAEGVGPVTRRRGKGVNSYQVGEGSAHDALGAAGTVPEEVRKALNLHPVNFQGQIDDPFWFLKTPGEISRELNGVINLSLIDTVQANLDAALRRARATQKQAAQRLEEAAARAERLAWVGAACEALERAEALEARADSLTRKTSRLAQLTQEGGKLTSELRRAVHAATGGATAVQKAGDAIALDDRVVKLGALLRRYTPAPPPGVFVRAIDKLKEAEDKATACVRLSALARTLETNERELWQAEERLGTAATALKATEGEACPLCGSPLTGG